MKPWTLLNQKPLERLSTRKLLLCSMTVPWPDRPTQGLYHIDQAQALQAAGVESTIFSPAPALWRALGSISPRIRRHVNRPKNYVMDGVSIASPRLRFAFPKWMRLQLAAQAPELTETFCQHGLTKALEQAIAQTDADGLLVHGTLPWASAASIAAGRASIPHAIIEHSYGDVMRLRKESGLAKLYQEAGRRAQSVFVVSHPMKRHLEQTLGLTNVRVALNGIGQDACLPAIRAEKDPDQPVSILSVGHYYRRKGFEELVQAFAALCGEGQNLRLELVTNGCSCLRQTIANTNARERITLLPLCPREALLRRMQQADLFVLPSWHEAFGLVYAEAMACGTPVVMTSSCGMAEMITAWPRSQRPGSVVEPQDVPALTQCLRVLVTDATRRRKMSQTASEFVRTNFSWATNAQIIRDGIWPTDQAQQRDQVAVPA